MNADKVAEVTKNISTALVTAGNVAEVIAPQYAVFIVLGMALAKELPDLEADVARLIAKKEPTAADKQLVAQKILSLTTPESL